MSMYLIFNARHSYNLVQEAPGVFKVQDPKIDDILLCVLLVWHQSEKHFSHFTTKLRTNCNKIIFVLMFFFFLMVGFSSGLKQELVSLGEATGEVCSGDGKVQDYITFSIMLQRLTEGKRNLLQSFYDIQLEKRNS